MHSGFEGRFPHFCAADGYLGGCSSLGIWLPVPHNVIGLAPCTAFVDALSSQDNGVATCAALEPKNVNMYHVIVLRAATQQRAPRRQQ